jgi:hypothetical protein
MKLPDGITEQEFVDIVNSIANKLCSKFKFGYYSAEDIRQECFIQAIDGLERYDSSRPLNNFLWTHIKNRLCNLKRDKYFRLEKPCNKCPYNAYCAKDDSCSAYDNKMDCTLYNVWYTKNTAKQNIMNPIGISCVNDENEHNINKNNDDVFNGIAAKEIIEIIDQNISISMRKFWLQKKAGINISKKNHSILIEEIHCILEENNIDVSKAW